VRYLYTCLIYLLTPFILLRLIWRSFKAPAYAKRWNERFGFFKAPTHIENGVWIHAVSMGETLAAIPLIKKLQETYPHLPITVTTMTPTGSAQVTKQLGDSVFHVYAPYDLPSAWQRFLNNVKPRFVVVMETELWPNMLHVAHEKNIPIIIANGRLSERSARGYEKVSRVTAEMLKNVSHMCAQYENDGARFVRLGLPKEKLSIVGNIKFDTYIKPELTQRADVLRGQWGRERYVIIAASTHESEENSILNACQDLWKNHPDLLLVIVPRHPERFAKVIELARARGLTVAVRSQQDIVDANTQVLIADTMGELLLLYATSDIAFVGGSLVNTGGHNMLEPISAGLPVITGKHVFNFARISELLLSKKAMIQVNDDAELTRAIHTLIEQPDMADKMIEAGKEVIAQNRGALDRVWAVVQSFV
jgi:3-deoxy-D-manno-octulosonic-acid transferase